MDIQHKLPAAVKEQWLKDLRSGIPQTKGVLKSNKGQCCLGVLCNQFDPGWRPTDKAKNSVTAYSTRNGAVNYPEEDDVSPEVREVLGQQFTDEHGRLKTVGVSLYEKNDGYGGSPPWTFGQIADWIEENL
jgi:hypothetical protein